MQIRCKNNLYYEEIVERYMTGNYGLTPVR